MAKRAWKLHEPTFQGDEVCPMNPVWPWAGHRNFAYDLVRWMRPARIVELGVHWGTSFFAFAQAVKDGRAKCHLVGVDTFEGDEQAGHYGPEVLDTVNRIKGTYFPRLNITVHQMLFSRARPLVEEESVDLLHIDGLHTYEAVREDYEAWLPTLADEGIVLFHDVAPDTGYGSTEYWRELSAEYPSFAFDHSWGLGVLFPKGDARRKEILGPTPDERLALYTARAVAARGTREVGDLKRMCDERRQGMERQGELIRQRDGALEALRRDIGTARALAEERAGAVARLTVQLQDRTAAADRQRQRAENAEQMARDRFEHMQKQSAVISQRDTAAAQLTARLEAARQLADERHAALQELRGRAHTLERELRESREAVARERAAQEETRDQLAAIRASVEAQARSGLERHEELAKLVRAALEASRRTSARADRLETDAELLTLRAEHLESIAGEHRASIAELKKSGAGVPADDWLSPGR